MQILWSIEFASVTNESWEFVLFLSTCNPARSANSFFATAVNSPPKKVLFEVLVILTADKDSSVSVIWIGPFV